MDPDYCVTTEKNCSNSGVLNKMYWYPKLMAKALALLPERFCYAPIIPFLCCCNDSQKSWIFMELCIHDHHLSTFLDFD